MKKNDKVKKSIAISALATGTVVLGSIVGATESKAANLFSFENLGSGAELRSELLSANDATNFIKNSELELKCGEGKAEGDKKSAKAESGKAKAEAKDGKAAEHKCGEGKCGEGKCGEHDHKTEKTEKTEKKKADDASSSEDDE